MKVVVTGASGYFGGVLIPALLADPRVTVVVGCDVMPAPAAAWADAPHYLHANVDLATATAADWAPILEDAGAVVHLAFKVAHRPGEAIAPTNVHGQRVFLTEALAAARQVVVASAIAVYGFAPGRGEAPLAEDTPRAPGTRVDYAEHKQAMEALLDALEPTSPATVIRARTTNVIGPTMPLARAPLLTNPVMTVPATRHPIRQQLLHERDLASAYLRLLAAPAGAYNVGPDDWLTVEEAVAITGQALVKVPGFILRGLADVAWRTGQSPFEPAWLAFMEHPPIIVANRKLRTLGWEPEYGTRRALEEITGLLRGRAMVR